MLADFPADQALNEPEFLARVGNFAWLRPEERARVLEIRRTALDAERARLTGLAARQADPWSRAALHHVLGKFDAELRWLAGLTTDPRENA
ncbi:hypothetical protein [Amycolatopsis sp. lyj-346]|uniref:hypothetical protein n=1 Tax=Amycolatopsis sp. lyj-346 TaxID=2789289 RepID=UPI003979954F